MADTFGEELRRRRERAGLTLGELASRIHYSKSHLSNIESGRKRPTLELVARCDSALAANGDLTGLFQSKIESARVRVPKPAQLPPSVGYFVGRTAARTRLDSVLATEARESAQIVAIDGAPGVGKTALAVRWAHDRTDQFPDGVLYADLNGYGPDRPVQQPAHAVNQFLRTLGVSGSTVAENLTARSALYRSLLHDRRILVVLDNAGSSEQVRPLLPGSPACLVVVTSRTRLAGLAVREGATRLVLDSLQPDEALALLRSLLGNHRIDAEAAAAALVAERCGYLPLALRIAAERAMARPGDTLAELADDLADVGAKLDILTAIDDESTALRTIFSWSYRPLPPASALMFRLISAHPGRDMTAAAAAALVDTSRARASRSLDHLASVSLLEERHTSDRYRLSPLLHVYAAERLRLDDSPSVRVKALDRVLNWYLRTAAAAARTIGPHQRHLRLARPAGLAEPAPFSGYGEALSWCDAELENLIAAVGAATAEGLDAIAWQLAVSLGPYFDLRMAWQAWIGSHHLGLTGARREANRVAEAWLLTNLATAYRHRGRLDEARDILEESLAIQRETGDHHGEALSLIQLGHTLAAQADIDKAHGRYLAALQLLPDVGDKHGEAMALLGVAAVYSAADQHHHAREPVDTALAIFRRLHDRRGEAAALDSLAVVYQGLGNFQEAMVELGHALEAWRDVDDRHGQAGTLHRHGQILDRLGQPAAAGSSWRTALAIFEKLDDPRASAVRAQLHDLGLVVALRNDDEAC